MISEETRQFVRERNLAWRKRQRLINPMNVSATAAHSELIACAYFLKKGYEVFRTMTFTSTFDLVICYDEKILRVDVKTGTKNKNTKRTYFARSDEGRNSFTDVYAVVISGSDKIELYDNKLNRIKL